MNGQKSLILSDFRNIFMCIYSFWSKVKFCEILNEIGPVALASVLGPHNDNVRTDNNL